MISFIRYIQENKKTPKNIGRNYEDTASHFSIIFCCKFFYQLSASYLGRILFCVFSTASIPHYIPPVSRIPHRLFVFL